MIWIRREEKVDAAVDPSLEDIGPQAVGAKSRRHAVPRLAKKPSKMIVCRARCKVSGSLDNRNRAVFDHPFPA